MENARAARDIIALHDEPQTAGSRPLLERVMVDGTRTSALLPLAHARVWCAERIAELPPDLRRIDRDASYDVQPSRGLTEAIRMAQGS